MILCSHPPALSAASHTVPGCWLRWRLSLLSVPPSWVIAPNLGFFPCPPVSRIPFSLAHPGSDFTPAAPLVCTHKPSSTDVLGHCVPSLSQLGVG